MKQANLKLSCIIFFLLCISCTQKKTVEHLKIYVESPFHMDSISIPIFPKDTFNIIDYGAKESLANNSIFINDAIKMCSSEGGGTVLIPQGAWNTGKIEMKSNVELHLSANSVLVFNDDPNSYLPAVHTSWEGMECYNYSPLIYAYECENISISGKGLIQPKLEFWVGWLRQAPHMEALKELYTKASTNVPVEQRNMAKNEDNLRPHLIQFNRCKNILLDGFQIEGSPFWTIHMYMSKMGVVRNLRVRSHGHNNDGIDLEMSQNFLVEDCVFDQGDDAVVIKSGRNQDAWRLNTPSKNIVIRNCIIKRGHAFLGIGSEMSGGVENVYMHDCANLGRSLSVLEIKTNERRGGFVRNIYMKNIKVIKTQRVVNISTDVLYQWRNLVPTYEVRIADISEVKMENITCEEADYVIDILGDKRKPIRNVVLDNITVKQVNKAFQKVENIEGLVKNNIVVDNLLIKQ